MKKIYVIFIFALLLVISSVGAVDTIRIGGDEDLTIDCIQDDWWNWKIELKPDSATNNLPLDTCHVFTAQLYHKNTQHPVGSKKILFSTTYGTLVGCDVGCNDGDCCIKTNSSGKASITVCSDNGGSAFVSSWLNGHRSHPVLDTSRKYWIGESPDPSVNISVYGTGLVLDGNNSTVLINVTNDGNVPLDDPTAMFEGENAMYLSGDMNSNGVLDVGETWVFTYEFTTVWELNAVLVYSAEGTAYYHGEKISDGDSLVYKSFILRKDIKPDQIEGEYMDTPFAVNASKGVETFSFTISVNNPAKMVLTSGVWTFFEKFNGVSFDYNTEMYGDATFVNRPYYKQILTNIIMTEHEVWNNLDKEEFAHTFYAIVTDQYGEPIANFPVTFDGNFTSGHDSVIIYTNISGVAYTTATVTTPSVVGINAFHDENEDSRFNETEIGDTCIKTWYYEPYLVPIHVIGESRVVNYLFNHEYEHTFSFVFEDQYNIPISNVNAECFIIYNNNVPRVVDCSGTSDENGYLNVTVHSEIEDSANISVCPSPYPMQKETISETLCAFAEKRWTNVGECSGNETKCDEFALYNCTDERWTFIENNSVQCGFVCENEDTKCVGYSLYNCAINQWELVEENSTECGYHQCTEDKCVGENYFECIDGSLVRNESLDEICISPECENGGIKCIEYDLYECTSGNWILKDEHSAQCGYVEPSPEPTYNPRHPHYNTYTPPQSFKVFSCSSDQCNIEGKGCVVCPDGEICEPIAGTPYGRCVAVIVPTPLPTTIVPTEIPTTISQPSPEEFPWWFAVILLICIALLGAGAYYFSKRKNNVEQEEKK